MAQADWSLAVGVLLFIIAIVVATIYYVKFKKFFLVLYVAAIATYAFAVFYTWDVFELSKNWVLGMLIVSTGLMFWLAHYFKKVDLKKIKKKK